MRRMFVTRRAPRLRLLVLGAGAIGVGALVLGAGSDELPAAARIGGPPLAAREAKAAAAPPAHGPPARISLDKMQLDGDHYVLPLGDGRRAVLTLDPDLQHQAERVLAQTRAPRAAIVAMAPDGRVLALAGRRTAEPKGGRTGTPDWHLAVDVWAPSASIFKLVTASALVGAGVDPHGRVCYHGGIRSVLEHNLRDDKRDNRCEDLAYGVAHSNNAILGKLAFQHLEPKQLADTARRLGWSAPLPATLALPGDAGSYTPPPARDLEFARTAAGFLTDDAGAKLSVMGGALIAATFANAGEQPAPRLIDEIDGVALPVAGKARVLPAATARAVAAMMARTCQDGSAGRTFHGRNVAGKTGTLTTTDPFYIEHSWFVGFAPADHPQIIVSVLVGNAEDWWMRGHEAARKMIDRALDGARAREKDRTSGPPHS